MARRLKKAQLFLATLVVSGAALLAASSAPHRASATFVAPTTPPTSSSSPSPQQLLSASSNLLDSVANATTHKLELLVASLGKLSPPWLTQIANEAGKRQHEAKAALGLPTTRATAAAATTSPAALPYAAPPTDAWLAADPCHAVPSPCAATKPFELSEVRPARASAGEGGGRLSAPAHLAPLTPTAPWSQVSGPGGESSSFSFSPPRSLRRFSFETRGGRRGESSGGERSRTRGRTRNSLPPLPFRPLLLPTSSDLFFFRLLPSSFDVFLPPSHTHTKNVLSLPPGSGPNPYWVTGQAATSVLGLSPGFEADPAASMVLEVAGEAALGRDTGRDAESAAVAAAPGRGLAAAEAGGASAGNISASALARASPSARRLLMAMKQQQQKMQQQKMQQRQQQGRKKLLASLPPPPSAASAPPPRASWSGALSASSPKDSSDNNNDNSGARFSATPLVVDTEGAGYRFQVSSAASWAPALALYRGGAIPPKGGERPQLVAASSSPLAGKPNSAVLSVRESLRRGEVYTLVVTAAADSAAAAGGDRDAAVGSFAALASGPGGVYPGATSVPPRWRVSSSTTAQAQGGAKEEEDSSPPPPSSSRGVLRRPEAEVDGARAGARAGARGGGDRDAPAVVAFEALPFVLASAGRGFELRVQAGASASSSPSTKGRSWSPWAAVYDADAFQQALDEAAARASPPGAPPALSTSGLVAAAVAAEGSGSVTLRGLSLEGAGKRYTLVVGGRTPADGGEFVAEAFGPEAIKGFVAPTPMPTPTPAAAPPPPSSSPPPPSPSSLPHLIEEASAPAPSSPPSSSGGRPRLLDPVSIDPPPPPPVRFAEYGIQVRTRFRFFLFSTSTSKPGGEKDSSFFRPPPPKKKNSTTGDR